VGGVPVSVVHVVDVVPVHDRGVAAVGPVIVVVARAVRHQVERHRIEPGASNGSRSRWRRRTHSPIGQVTTNPASESRTMVDPGATVA